MITIIHAVCVVYFTVITTANVFLSAAPTWVTSDFFRAGNQNIINTLTGSSSTPEYTFIFSSPLPGIPKLAYGIKNYKGNDYFGQQTFEIRRINLTNTSYKVAVQISGPTNIWILNVPYIAIDPLFPHHLNSFDNVPVNYNAGDLTNITAKSTTQLLKYTNVVNYTQQASGLTYTRFKSPLSNNKILFYIMALNIRSTNEGNVSPSSFYPIDFHITLTILSEETYEIKVTLQKNVQINYLHLSQIMYDSDDVESSKKYFVVTQYHDVPRQGQFIPVPEEFRDNFIMGLTDFSTLRGQSVLNYNWQFQTKDGVFGANIEQSIPKDTNRLSTYALQRQGTMVFYIKTWKCPTGYDFFNLTTNMCQDMCGDYHFENDINYRCQYCNYSCLDCTSGHDCLTCSGDLDHRILTGEKSCQCQSGYYETQGDTKCLPCQGILPNCIDCFYNNSYSSSDSAAGSLEKGCFQCDQTTFLQNFQCHPFITCPGTSILNTQTNACETCNIDGCTSCSTLTQCATCDESANKFLNPSTKQCQSCKTPFCEICASLDQCSKCKETFVLSYNSCLCLYYHYFDQADQKCLSCSPYCKTCTGPTPYECTSCFYEQHRLLIGQVCVCDSFAHQQPAPDSQSYECERISDEKCDRGFIYIRQEDRCEQLCGDGVVVEVECDDGNIENGDGCSDQCLIETHFNCSTEIGEKSICKLSGTVEIPELVIIKNPISNQLELILDISPETTTYENYDFKQALKIEGADIEIKDAYIQDGKLILKTQYSENLLDKEIQIKVKDQYYYGPDSPPHPENLYTTSKLTFTLGSPQSINYIEASPQKQQFKVTTLNNQEPYYFTDQQYETFKQSEKVVLSATILGLTAAALMLFIKNSLSTLVIVSCLQVAYIGLSSVNGLNPVSTALTAGKPVLGYNINEIPDETDRIPSQNQSIHNRISSLGFTQKFADNFNIMLFCCIGLLMLTSFFYIASLKKPGMKVAFRLIQRETMLFILFNTSGAFFSLSIIRQMTIFNSVLISLTILVFGYQIVHFLKNAKNYFGMENTFNFEKPYFQIFIVALIICRLSLCLSLGIIEDLKMAPIAGIACQALFVIFLLLLRPFLLIVNNILVILGELVGIGYFATIYSMEGLQSDKWIGGWVLVGCFLGMAVLAISNLTYSLIKDCFFSKKETKIANVDGFKI